MFVENPNMPQRDSNCVVSPYVRTKEDNDKLGLSNAPDDKYGGEFKYEDLEGEVLRFGTNCPNCAAPCETNMKVTSKYFELFLV